MYMFVLSIFYGYDFPYIRFIFSGITVLMNNKPHLKQASLQPTINISSKIFTTTDCRMKIKPWNMWTICLKKYYPGLHSDR